MFEVDGVPTHNVVHRLSYRAYLGCKVHHIHVSRFKSTIKLINIMIIYLYTNKGHLLDMFICANEHGRCIMGEVVILITSF